MNELWLGLIALFAVVLYVLLIGLAVADYVVRSLGMYRLAAKLNISNVWLSWLPIGHEWILGSVADAFDRKKGLNRKWRVALLTVSLLAICLFVLFYVALFIMVFMMMAVASEEPTGDMIALFALVYIGILLFMLVAVALEVLSISCMYKIYDEAYPEKTVKYLLLSYLVPLAQGICLLRAGEHYTKMEAAAAQAVLIESALEETPETPDDNETM